MNKIVFPLKLQMKRVEVGDLHQALTALGFEIAAKERKEQRFGAATRRAVVAFQEKHGLEPTGVVDQKTAARINREPKNERAKTADDLYVVQGGTIIASSPKINSAKPDETVDVVIGKAPTSEKFVVRGHVAGANGDHLVRAYDQDFRSWEPLGESPIDSHGNYEIRYTANKFRRAEKGAADLRVVIVTADGCELPPSDIHFNAAPEETIDLVAGPGPVAPSEYERYLVELERVLQGVALIDIDRGTPEEKERDLNFLAGDTGIDRQHIAWLVQAAACQEKSKSVDPTIRTRVSHNFIPAAFFYGCFRLGLTTDLAELWSRSTDSLITKLKKSIEANLVPRALLDQLVVLEAIINHLRAARVLEPAPEGKPSSLGDLLGTLPPEEALSHDQQFTFAKLRDEHGDTDTLWKQAGAAGLSKAIPALKRTFALGKLTEGHPLLVNALQTKSDAMRPESVEFLTALEPIDWIELVFEHGVPPGSGLDRDGYIDQLQADVEGKFHTQMLSKQLEKLLGESERFPTRKVLDFFESNPGLDLKTQHVESYLNETENQDDIPLREGLLKLQRIDVLTVNARETRVLLDAGYGSATQMVNEGKPAFELKVANQLSPERAGEVFAAAETVVTTVAVVATAYVSPSASGNAVHVIPPPSVSGKKLKEYPSLRSLFGDLDYCECRHCKSVLGPAAYLTDLMHFLQRSKLTANPGGGLSDANYDLSLNRYLEFAVGGTVLGALLQRRPDLADLELSCENTDTKIPYIDLVLEILENAVALPLAVVVEGIDINAEFAGGKVPVKVAEALRETNIRVGKNLTVTADTHQGSSSPFLNWIIKDGSRRWLVQHRKQQFILGIKDAGNFQQVSDVAGAVDSLKNGKLNAELEGRLLQGLPLDGAPQIQKVPTPNSIIQGWIATYTRAIAIKITMGKTIGTVEWLKLEGTQFKPPRQWRSGTVQVIAHAFTSGATTKINPNVAQLLGLPANETYLQTWNPTRNWWELRVENTALFVHLLEGLNVSGLTHQNSSIRENLTSSPENRNPAAYDILSKDAIYPWALPFDLWLEETRAFLDALGIPRAHLIDMGRPQARLSEEAAALELFGLSKSEAELITSAAAAAEPWIYWGLAEENNTVQDHTAGSELTGNWKKVLEPVSMLLQQSGLSYREYLDFRETGFAWQHNGTLLPPNECKTSKIFLTGLNATQFTNHLNRIHVFTRLWRKSGWSMRDLDLALAAFGGQITPTILQDLALLKRLSAGLGLPVSVLVGCIHQLETQAWTDHTKDGSPIKPALYDAVFQRQPLRSLTGFDDFALEKVDSPPPTLHISDRADFVTASLGIKPDQVKAWISGTPNLGIADLASLDSLSRLYAAASLCRTLRIAPDALLDIVTLLLGPATDLFRTLPAPTTPDEIAQQARARARAMLEFVERVGFVRKSGFDFETLSYLLRHKVLPDGASDAGAKVEQQLTQTLTELRSALQTGVVLGDVSADNLKRQLALLGWYPALIDAAMGSDGLNYQPGASVEISLLPTPEPKIPLDLRSQFSYRNIDAKKAVLECSGSLKDTDFASIDNLFPPGSVTVTDLKTKYKTQLDAQAKALASLLQIIELAKLPTLTELPTVTETLTGLTALPVIPGELKDRLKFEFEMNSATRGNLTLTGWLSDAEKKTVTDANPLLRAVVNSLQEKALHEIPAPTPPQTLLDAELLLREPDVEKRYRTILLRLVSRLELDLMVAQLSGALSSDPQVVDTLLDAAKVKVNNTTVRSVKDLLTDSKFLRSDAKKLVDRTTWPYQFESLELLGKIATIANRLTIKPGQLDWILGGSFAVMNVLALPTSATTASTSFDDWRKLVDLFHLRDVLPDGAKRLAEVHEALKLKDEAIVHKERKVREVFAQAFELDRQQADDACGAKLLNFDAAGPDANDHNNPSRLLELTQFLQVTKLLGTTCSKIEPLIKSRPTKAEAQLARTLFAASINADEFPERLRPISNRLRNLQRDALVAYLIHRDHLADSNELFDRYLIDVEMGSCMLTSRIKQAISSVQLFVQRCLLNLERPIKDSQGLVLEPGVTPDSIDTQRWQWMKSYRVWEANRKVFLYPENWIEPELRDDKTEIFRTFESDLLQSEITHDTALLAFRNYLDKMGDVVNLTVVGMFEEQLRDSKGNVVKTIVHLVGRDNSQPYKHYYRQWKMLPTQDFGTWTAWEEISIQADSDHVMVFVLGGSVFLAWPSISGQGSDQEWQIRMNLCKRTASGWTKLKKGRGDITHPMVPNKDERTGFAFRLAFDDPQSIALIRCYGMSKPEGQLVEKPRDEKFTTGASNSSVTLIWLYLNIRTLAKFTDSSGKSFYYKATDFTCEYEIEFKYQEWNNFDNGPRGPEITKRSSFIILDIANSGPRVLYDKLKSRWPGFEPTDGSQKSMHLTEIVSITIKASANNSRYISPSYSAQTTTGIKDVIFVTDVVFDLQPGVIPEGYTEAALNLTYLNSFKLTDDDVFETFSENYPPPVVHPVPPGNLPNAEHFMSGYRELNGGGALALDNNLQVLKSSPGQYFMVQAQSVGAPTRQIWSYRDDRHSLLFWKKNATEQQYRVVPFTTLGMTALKSDVTRGRLLDAVALPLALPRPGGTLQPIQPDVGSGIDSADTKSVTKVRIDFGPVPTSIYNWEVFFHNPLLVATQLSQAQRFEEAQRWFHLIFDPTTNEAGLESVRYWRFLPFREAGKGDAIDKLLEDLAQHKFPLKDQIDEWAENPFHPHLVARQRPRSYQFAVVQKYLENLIAWGDQLFRRDTIESINEATQLYVLAARILGKRPASSPKTGAIPKSYRDIYRKLDDFSNAWIALEGPIATVVLALYYPNGMSSPYQEHDREIPPILNLLGGLYFCVPGNEKLSEYGDTVEDRLFKIRHCMNIEGIERQLPLFEPPIDPALLVRATAAGLDLAAVLSDVQAPLPLYRFNVMVQKALELCSEVRALGNALLSALEKKDAEEFSLLRSSHEIKMLKLVRAIKEQQQQEAEANLEALRKTREITVQRYLNYQRLLGKQNIVEPAEGAAAALESSALQLTSPAAGDTDTQGLALISAESDQMGWLNDGNRYSLIAGSHSVLAGVLHVIPQFTFGITIPVAAQFQFGGSHLGSAMSAVGDAWGMLATNASYQAGRSATIGGHQRRYDEWRFQSNTAAKELEQIDKQILANEIRKQIAEREITNHDQQFENTQAVDEFMRDKFTSQQLYSWMVGQISRVYFRTYQLAHDISKRAERTYRFELDLKQSSFIEFGYWNSLKEGLVVGERLYLDLKRMEAAYLDKNKREYEITKHVSLMQLDPVALLHLKETGQCEASLPEALLDLDFPGHYLRRIKSVSLTIPCVTGPYSSVPCTLTLLKHSVRQSNNASGNYTRDIENDDLRFIDSFGAIQSIVTSNAQNDSGLFETNLRDERYLPFEGAGVISNWRLELPATFRPFDYSTISDVILHIRYTARDGGAGLKQKCAGELGEILSDIERASNETGLARIFSLRHEFPTEWSQLTSGTNQNPAVARSQSFAITKNRFPFLFAGKQIKISSVDLYALLKPDADPLEFPAMTVTLPKGNTIMEDGGSKIGRLRSKRLTLDEIRVDAEEGTARWKLEIPNVAKFQKDIDDILMVCYYKLGVP